MEEKKGEYVEGLARGLKVLECFDKVHAVLTLSDVSRRADLNPAAARRSLNTLERLGYVRRIDRKFVLSARVLTLGSVYLRSANSEELLLPELRRLVGLFGDSASVATLDRQEVLYIASYSEQRAKRMMATAGTTFPAYATSLGKVMLSSMKAEEISEYFNQVNFQKLTDKTLNSPEAISEQVALVRELGYATSVDELDYGITSLAVPVKNSAHQTVAAINCSAYSGRVTAESLIEGRLEELRVAASKMERVLASHPALMFSLYLPQ